MLRNLGEVLPRAQGLANVGATARVLMVQGSSRGAALVGANFRQPRGTLVDAGYVTSQPIGEDLEQLDDPAFTMPSSVMWIAWGQRPV